MRTIEVKLYKFNELSDKAKEKAISDYRANETEYHFWSDALASLEAFGARFNVSKFDYEISPYSHSWISSSADAINFRGVKLKDFTGDEMPTGYCADYPLWNTFYVEFKNLSNAQFAFEKAINAWLKDTIADMEDAESDERIAENIECNEYEFDEDGVMQ